MKFSIYNYITNLNSRIINLVEKIALKKNWLIDTMFYCSITSLFFAFPSFEAWDNPSRLHNFLLQCESITGFWRENKISNTNFRLTVPLFIGFLGGGHFLSILLRYAVGILLFGFCTKIIYNFTKDRVSAILFSFTLALTNPGVTSFCEFRGIFDGVAIFLIILSLYFRNYYLIIFVLLLAFFSDERTLVSAGFLFTYGVLNIKGESDLIRSAFHKINFPVFIALITYLLIRYQITNSYGLGLSEVNQLQYGWKLLNQINNIPIAAWSGLEGFWIIIVLKIILLFNYKKYFPALIFIFSIIFLIILGNSVNDTTRSMLYLFPAVIVSMKEISKYISKNELRSLLLFCLFISFIFPSYMVGGKSTIWWQYPMPIQIIRWFFVI